MAIKAPTHEKRVGLHHKRHLVNLAMARCTADPFLHMDAVIEVNKIGQIVDSNPLKRFAGAIAVSNGLKDGCFSPNLGMAAHARMCRGNPRIGADLHGTVTVAAINPQSIHVVFVTEHHRLFAEHVDLAEVG